MSPLDSARASPRRDSALLNNLGQGGYTGICAGEAQNPGPATHDRDWTVTTQPNAAHKQISSASGADVWVAAVVVVEFVVQSHKRSSTGSTVCTATAHVVTLPFSTVLQQRASLGRTRRLSSEPAGLAAALLAPSFFWLTRFYFPLSGRLSSGAADWADVLYPASFLNYRARFVSCVKMPRRRPGCNVALLRERVAQLRGCTVTPSKKNNQDGAWSGVMKRREGSDVNWIATLCIVLTIAAVTPPVPFLSAAPPAVLARTGAWKLFLRANEQAPCCWGRAAPR